MRSRAPRLRATSIAAILIFIAAAAHAQAVPSGTAEFEGPYQLRILDGGTELEVRGAFSWALPQNFQAALAQSPQVRLVRLESLGGHVKSALEVAVIIRARGLDTYVGGFCVSACTIAFLSGRERTLGPGARLGFHQAHGPGITPEQASSVLRHAYQVLGVPPGFINQALRVPPSALWFPTLRELKSAGLTTAEIQSQ